MGCSCSSGKAAQRQAAEPSTAAAAGTQARTEPAEPQPQQQQQQQQQPEKQEPASTHAGEGAGKEQAADAGDVKLSLDNDASPVHTGVAHAPSAPVIHDPTASPPAAAGRDGGAAEDGAGAAANSKFDAQGRRRQPAHTVPASFFKASEYNGFKTKQEVPSLLVSEDGFAQYTLPAECLNFEPPPEAVITKFKNGDQERKIYTNTEISTSEYERVVAMRAEAKAAGAEFFPSVTCMATRFLSRARMDPKKALKLMKDTQEWRAQFFKDGPVSDKELLEDFKHGIVYFTGRDFCLRPAIVIRAARIPQQWYKEKRIDKFIRMLIFCMEYFLRYMVVPGRVENLSVIADLGSLGISQVPLGALGEVYKVLGHHYIGRVFKFYVVHVSSALSVIAGMAKGLLTDRQKQKLNILDDINELRKEFALTQLEEDLGGSRPKLSSFYPFPLLPGPYTPGYNGEVDSSAVPNVHEAITFGGAIGRLWEPRLSLDENTRLEYTPKAQGILERCGLPVPPEARADVCGDGPMFAATSRSADGLVAEATASQTTLAPQSSWGSQPDKVLSVADTTPGMTPSTDDASYREGGLTMDTGAPMEDLDLRADEVMGDSNHEIQSQSVGGCKGLFCCSI